VGDRKWMGGKSFKSKKELRSALRKAEKGQTKRVNLGWHRDRKENPISAPSIHVGALVGAASLCPEHATDPLASIHALRKACFVFYVNNLPQSKSRTPAAEPLHCQGSLCLATLEAARFRCLVCCCLSSLVVIKDRN
jgi:hypothetical protein